MGINLFREINPEDVYGRIDDVIIDLDITANLTTSIQKYMTELKDEEMQFFKQMKILVVKKVFWYLHANFSNDQILEQNIKRKLLMVSYLE